MSLSETGLELVLEDDDIGTAEAADEGDLDAALVHLFGDGIGDGAADAAADNADLVQAFHLGGLAEGADKVADIVALLDGVEHLGGLAGRLDHDGDGPLFAVIARDGNGNALALLVKAENNKLPGLRVPGNQGRLHFKEADGFRVIEITLGDNLVHTNSPSEYTDYDGWDLFTQILWGQSK